MPLNIAHYDPLKKGFHTMKTTAYQTAERLHAHPVCLWQSLPAFFPVFFHSNTEKKNQTKNEVTVGNGSKSTHGGLKWVIIILYFKIITIKPEDKKCRVQLR